MCKKILLVLHVLALGILLCRSDPPVGEECKKVGDKPSCVCQHPDGIIDLTPLSSSNGPKFGPVVLQDFKYYYNPCKVFTLTNGCDNIYACQEGTDGSHYKLGDENSEVMYYNVDNDKSSVILYYSSPTNDDSLRETRVHLVCNTTLEEGMETITTTGDSETTLVYKFILSTCYACPGGCHGHGGHGGGGGGGQIAGPIGLVLIFLFIAGLLAYFIIGAVIMQVHYQKTGLDIIPNRGFWFSLPILIKDGVLFVLSPCIGSNHKADYQSL